MTWVWLRCGWRTKGRLIIEGIAANSHACGFQARYERLSEPSYLPDFTIPQVGNAIALLYKAPLLSLPEIGTAAMAQCVHSQRARQHICARSLWIQGQINQEVRVGKLRLRRRIGLLDCECFRARQDAY